MNRIGALIFTLLFLPLCLGAQNVVADELPADARDSVISITIVPRTASPCIDTIPTSNPRVQIAFFEDHTWQFIKNIESFSEDSLFLGYWDTAKANPFQVDIAVLPDKVTLWLVDSLSSFACPYQRKVFSKFGWRRGRLHVGVDLPLPVGSPVYAAFDGKVRVSTLSKGYGNVVIIRHINGLETTYGHLSEAKVSSGDWVHAGDVIGLGGSTGRSTGPHLHFETRYMGFAFDPQWIIDFENGVLRHKIFVLKRRYMQPGCQYVPESEDVEDAIYGEDEAEAAAMYHKIKSGDTLGSLAIKYHTTVSAICRLNGISSKTVLSIGRVLRVK